MVKSEILIVDDSEINRGVLHAMLEDEYDVVEAADGVEALQLIESGKYLFRLVLLDIVMPNMDGFELLKVLQEKGLASSIPVIIISSDCSEGSLSKAYDSGALDFFGKPFNHKIVHHRVKNIISLYEREYRDSLTGCYNRNGFIQVVDHFFHRHTNWEDYSILLYDLKNFKALNSLLGTDGGDEILRLAAHNLEHAPFAPLFVARMGADHFVCVAERSRVNLDQLVVSNNNSYVMERNGRQVQVRFRCGVAHLEKGGTVTGFLDRAKLALNYIEDEYLKPYAVFDDQMSQNYVNSAVVTSEFERSMQNEEFKVYYQPVMEVATGKVASAEALIRWIHPERGFVRPDLFIPALEKDGFISKLDLFVDKKVESVVDSWKSQGLPYVPVSVNLSWMDFYDKDMIQNILDRLESRNVCPGMVRYEITESSFAALKENRGNVLMQMQRLGAWLLMDDFGSGYSSLGMLMNYKFDVLKIDMSFVRQLEQKPQVRHIIETIIVMCHKLGMKVVAEGAETETQVKALREMSCDYIQGYYFSKPLPEAEFKEFLAKYNAEGKIVEYK